MTTITHFARQWFLMLWPMQRLMFLFLYLVEVEVLHKLLHVKEKVAYR